MWALDGSIHRIEVPRRAHNMGYKKGGGALVTAIDKGAGSYPADRGGLCPYVYNLSIIPS